MPYKTKEAAAAYARKYRAKVRGKPPRVPKTEEEKKQAAAKWREEHREETREKYRAKHGSKPRVVLKTQVERRARATEKMNQWLDKDGNRERVNAERRERLATDPKHQQHLSKVRKTWRDSDPGYNMFANARNRAKRDGLPFTITREDIVIPEFCPALGVKLEAGSKLHQPNSPSLDKIVPEKGYVPGNIVVVSFLANSIKRDATVEQLCRVAEFYRDL